MQPPAGVTEHYDSCPFIEQRSASVSWDGNVSPCLALLHSHTSYLAEIKRSVQRHRFVNPFPTCGGCQWVRGVIHCP